MRDLDDDFPVDLDGDFQMVSRRVANDELVLTSRRGPGPFELTCTHNAEAVFGDQFNRAAAIRRTVDFQVFFLDRHLNMWRLAQSGANHLNSIER